MEKNEMIFKVAMTIYPQIAQDCMVLTKQHGSDIKAGGLDMPHVAAENAICYAKAFVEQWESNGL